jgi:HlyD family secretion protein
VQTQICSAEYAADSLEGLLADRSRASHAIYLLVIAGFLSGVAMLPLVHVDVSVRSSGIVRPVTEKHEVRARASGLVSAVLVRENDQVKAGDPIVELTAAAVEEQGRVLDARAAEYRRAIADLQQLLTSSTGANARPAFQTARYGQAFAQFRTDLTDAEQRLAQAQREAERTRVLGARQMTAPTEVEEKEFRLAQARAAVAQVRERYLTAWQGELAQARRDSSDLTATRSKLAADLDLFRVVAPVAGTIEQVRGLSAGSYVTAGEPVVVISPSDALLAEVYVSPRDIGLLRIGGPVRLQVDAFNYNDWGMLTGRVREISDDYVMVGDRPVFKVKCTLDRDDLRLANGFRGRVKKGMTVQARFVVARRTLFQMLHENINDWLNPVHSS